MSIALCLPSECNERTYTMLTQTFTKLASKLVPSLTSDYVDVLDLE